MSPLGLVLLAIIIALPLAWLMSEFRSGRSVRVSLGILAIGVVAFCSWALASVLTRFNYNAWYGGATEELISTSLHQIEEGQLDRVLKVWRSLDEQYQPTYESRARYRELVEEATERMRGDISIQRGSPWDASVFKAETWLGHWEDDGGYWIVINDSREPFDILRSGYPPSEMHSISVSPDFTVLEFKEGTNWVHTLTLNNKYEATHEWFDLEANSVWKTDTMHKLVRPSEEQKRMTQQDSVPGRAETNQTPQPE